MSERRMGAARQVLVEQPAKPIVFLVPVPVGLSMFLEKNRRTGSVVDDRLRNMGALAAAMAGGGGWERAQAVVEAERVIDPNDDVWVGSSVHAAVLGARIDNVQKMQQMNPDAILEGEGWAASVDKTMAMGNEVEKILGLGSAKKTGPLVPNDIESGPFKAQKEMEVVVEFEVLPSPNTIDATQG
eukprot:gene6874-21204_t